MTPRRLAVQSTPPAPLGACGGCAYRQPCGGLDEEASLFGCFVDCSVACQRDTGGRCDYTCPERPEQFARRWREVGGLPVRLPSAPLKVPHSELPTYVPLVRHGSRRELVLDEPHVALATFDFVGGAGRRYGPRAADGAALRRKLVLRDDAHLLFVSVAQDAALEQYWALATELEVPRRIEALGLWGMTAPNFSFFDRVPRTQILYNRARIVRATEALSHAGVPAVVHVNAVTRSDWRFWADLLRDQPHVRYVAKEFQTGARGDRERAEQMIRGLEYVQARISQELHPIVIGGTQYAARIASAFPHVTFVDSRPFMNAVKRQRFVMDVLGARWEPSPTADGEPIDDLLASNIRTYRRYVEALAGRADRSTVDAAATVAALRESEDELLVDAPDEGDLRSSG